MPPGSGAPFVSAVPRGGHGVTAPRQHAPCRAQRVCLPLCLCQPPFAPAQALARPQPPSPGGTLRVHAARASTEAGDEGRRRRRRKRRRRRRQQLLGLQQGARVQPNQGPAARSGQEGAGGGAERRHPLLVAGNRAQEQQRRPGALCSSCSTSTAPAAAEQRGGRQLPAPPGTAGWPCLMNHPVSRRVREAPASPSSSGRAKRISPEVGAPRCPLR